MTRALAAVAAASLLLLSAHARADSPGFRDAKNYCQLDLPHDWQRLAAAPGPEAILLAARGPRSTRTLALTRIDYPNPKRTKSAFHDQVERGLKSSTSGYKRLRRKHRKIRRVPVMDLVFRRDRDGSREVVWMRFLFFRTFTLTLAVTAPAKLHRRLDRRTRKLVDTFQPYFAED